MEINKPILLVETVRKPQPNLVHMIDLRQFSNIRAVLDLLNLLIRTDVAIGDGPELGLSIGWCGMQGQRMGSDAIQASPTVATFAELDEFCGRHMAEYQAVAEAVRANGQPDGGTWFWQKK